MPATIEDLGKKVKAKYPGQYDDLPDVELGQKIKSKYPEDYADFDDLPKGPPNASDFLKETISNIPSSAGNVVSGLGNAVGKAATDPSTLLGPNKALYDIYKNATGQDSTYKDIFNYYKDRVSHPLQTLHDDPVGAGLDVLSALEGGSGVLKGTGRALQAAGEGAAGSKLYSTGSLASPATRLGTPAKAILKGAIPKTVDVGTSLLEGVNPLQHPLKVLPDMLRGIRDITKAGAQSLADSHSEDILNQYKGAYSPLKKEIDYTQIPGVGPVETPFRPPETVKLKDNLSEPSGDFDFKGTGTKFTPSRENMTGKGGKSYPVNPPKSQDLDSFELKTEDKLPSGDFPNRKGTGTKYTPNKEALRGRSSKSYFKKPGKTSHEVLDPESEESNISEDEEVQEGMPEGLIKEIESRLTSQPTTKGQLKTKTSNQLRKTAKDLSNVPGKVNSVETLADRLSKNPKAIEAARKMKESLEGEDPYEIQIEN